MFLEVLAGVRRAKEGSQQVQDKGLFPEAHRRRSPLNVTTDRAAFHCFLNLLERILAALHILCSAEVLKDLDRTQRLSFCLHELMLLPPNRSLSLDRAAQVVQVIGSVKLELFDVSVCIIEPFLIEEYQRQGEANLK